MGEDRWHTAVVQLCEALQNCGFFYSVRLLPVFRIYMICILENLNQLTTKV